LIDDSEEHYFFRDRPFCNADVYYMHMIGPILTVLRFSKRLVGEFENR
jgi:hypothetical protein